MQFRIVFTVGRASPTGCLHCHWPLVVEKLGDTARLKRFGIPRMMTRKLNLLPLWLVFAAAIAFVLPATPVLAQTTPDQKEPGSTLPEINAPATPAKSSPTKGSPAKEARPRRPPPALSRLLRQKRLMPPTLIFRRRTAPRRTITWRWPADTKSRPSKMAARRR